VTKTEDRFWSKVLKTDHCWLWLRGKTAKGYGQFHIGNTKIYAHRYSYALAFGDIPEGEVVDHRCHVHHCVRPSHLRAVTDKQNKENRSKAEGVSGVRGVYQDKRTGRWVARVTSNRVKFHVGVFDTLDEAREAVTLARLQHFTHSDGR